MEYEHIFLNFLSNWKKELSSSVVSSGNFCKYLFFIFPSFAIFSILPIKLFVEKFQKKNDNKDFDLAAEDLRLATRHLGIIVGKVDVEEILGSIFNDFCIGK